MNSRLRILLFVFFLVSGFCGLTCQLVWTRLAFASFGVVTPVLSIVVSVFMLGLALGAWAGGKLATGWISRSCHSALMFYGVAESLIGLGAVLVPKLFIFGREQLLNSGATDSNAYLLLSGLILALAILPWCVCMGATFPLALAFVRERASGDNAEFSFLYLANVLGALAGTLITAFVLIETFGFGKTLFISATANFLVAFVSITIGWRKPLAQNQGTAVRDFHVLHPLDSGMNQFSRRRVLWILFLTGFVAMAMEVVWTRAFAPVIKTQVYSFALVLATYLVATFVGSWWYRRSLRQRNARPLAATLVFLPVAGLLPVLLNDARLVELNWDWHGQTRSIVVLLGGIVPLCVLFGHLTPRLVDAVSAGSPALAGRAYAVNVLGCILGPLVAAYFLLPNFSERHALVLLCVPLIAIQLPAFRDLSRRFRFAAAGATCIAFTWGLSFSISYDRHAITAKGNGVVRRDHVASVIACGSGMEKDLFVNGIGTTTLTPITKFMVHLPLAFHREKPTSAAIICFGMGTSHRAALSWGIETTSVELVPGVKESFPFFHADAAAVLANPRGRVLIDDGRRFLQRTRDSFDVIIVDPPPPPEAAASSLLYSDEFYALVKHRLKPGGIFQAWLPGGIEPPTVQAMLRSIRDAFPYVRCFGSIEGWGVHVLCSNDPIPSRNAAELARRLPDAARADLIEWNPDQNAADWFQRLLANELRIEGDLPPDESIRISDDRPYNEYFFLRRLRSKP